MSKLLLLITLCVTSCNAIENSKEYPVVVKHTIFQGNEYQKFIKVCNIKTNICYCRENTGYYSAVSVPCEFLEGLNYEQN